MGEAQVKVLTVELESLSISAARKMQMRDTIRSYGMQVVAWKKNNAAKQTARIVDSVVEAANKISGNKLVIRCDFGIDGKIAKAVRLQLEKKVKDKALLLVSADMAGDRYMVMAFAPKGLKDIDCKAWAIAATEGNGGGKKNAANFSVPGVGSIDDVLEKARRF